MKDGNSELVFRLQRLALLFLLRLSTHQVPYPIQGRTKYQEHSRVVLVRERAISEAIPGRGSNFVRAWSIINTVCQNKLAASISEPLVELSCERPKGFGCILTVIDPAQERRPWLRSSGGTQPTSIRPEWKILHTRNSLKRFTALGISKLEKCPI